jgi:uncharacterized peroxidase-related enzyme
MTASPVRQSEPTARAAEAPVVDGLPQVPGINVAMKLSPGLEQHLRGLANILLVEPFPDATLTRGERELLATGVSAGNDCFFCMDTHGAFAAELLAREKATDNPLDMVDRVKVADTASLGDKMRALLRIAETVRTAPRTLGGTEVDAARSAGATDGDVQLAVLIASAFCMYNRMVEGFRAPTPAEAGADYHRVRAEQIADHGYFLPAGIEAGRR